MKKILLTFDVEEFDLPLEYNQEISQKEIFEIPKQGLTDALTLLDKFDIPATFFTTANFAKKFPSLIKNMSKNHEIACHGYEHSDSYIKDISKIQIAKQELEKIIKKKVLGFRAPRFAIKNISGLSEFGFKYDSSIHPTFIPGRYNNLSQNRKIHKINGLTEVPLSVLPITRLPIFWLAFRNFPLSYAKAFTQLNSSSGGHTMPFFHPWEFTDLSKFKIPTYIKRKTGQELLNKLKKYILFCEKKGYGFSSVGDYVGK